MEFKDELCYTDRRITICLPNANKHFVVEGFSEKLKFSFSLKAMFAAFKALASEKGASFFLVQFSAS